MPNKPTYEELEQRVKELEQDTVKRKQAEEAFKQSEEKFKNLSLLKKARIGIGYINLNLANDDQDNCQ
jgi:hypothetical protein